MTMAEVVAHVRKQALACEELGSPLYAVLLDRLADDLEIGGPGAQLVAGHEGDPGPSALALRLMGGVHRLVLQRRAPSLAMFYPSVGGCGAPDEAWPAFRGVQADHVVELRRRLDQAPQTNEVGRASALMGGLQHLASARPGPFGSSRSAPARG